MIDLRDKVVVVTGAGAGIGSGLAGEAAARGARVAVVDIRKDAAEATCQTIIANGRTARAYQGDVTDADAMVSLADRIEADFGKINMVFNNAGVISGGTIFSIPPLDFAWIMDVNVRGLFNALRAFQPALERAVAAGDTAHIVNMGSENALALPTMGPFTAYTASKHAILGMTDGLRRDLKDKGITVSLICPGLVQTELWNAKRTRPEKFGGAFEAPPASSAAVASGRTVEATVKTAFEGLDAGEFIIVTDPRIRGFTEERLEEISRALAVADARVTSI